MTCIVGIAQAGRVVIGGDASRRRRRAGASPCGPTPRCGRRGSGLSASPRRSGWARSCGTGSTPRPARTARRSRPTWPRRWVDHVRHILTDGGWLQTKEGRADGGTFLVGHAGRLFIVEDDFQVGEAVDGFAAVGSGARWRSAPCGRPGAGAIAASGRSPRWRRPNATTPECGGRSRSWRRPRRPAPADARRVERAARPAGGGPAGTVPPRDRPRRARRRAAARAASRRAGRHDGVGQVGPGPRDGPARPVDRAGVGRLDAGVPPHGHRHRQAHPRGTGRGAPPPARPGRTVGRLRRGRLPGGVPHRARRASRPGAIGRCWWAAPGCTCGRSSTTWRSPGGTRWPGPRSRRKPTPSPLHDRLRRSTPWPRGAWSPPTGAGSCGRWRSPSAAAARSRRYGPGLEAYPPIRFRLLASGCRMDVVDARIATRYAPPDGRRVPRRGPRACWPTSGGCRAPPARRWATRELFGHLAGRATLEEALETAVRRTRRFARRQRSWFARDPRITWLRGADPADLEAPLAAALGVDGTRSSRTASVPAVAPGTLGRSCGSPSTTGWATTSWSSSTPTAPRRSTPPACAPVRPAPRHRGRRADPGDTPAADGLGAGRRPRRHGR